MRHFRVLLRLIIATVVILGCTGLGASLYLNSWGEAKFVGELAAGLEETPAVLHFPAGTRLVTLAGRLEALGLIDSSSKYYLFEKLNHRYQHFQAGTYKFDNPVSPAEISKKLIAGEVHRAIALEFNIPEGFSLPKVINRLAALKIAPRDELYQLAYDSKFVRGLGIEAPSLEGYVYPATYRFYEHPNAAKVFQAFVGKFRQMVGESLIAALAKTRLSLQEAVIFASLIEKETLHDDERPKIAEVIWRRLKNREPLGIDAATIYGVEDFDGDLKWSHLNDKKNEYNLRVHRGLPPGPIASPTVDSLKAILKPTDKGYYYYVLVADGAKRHHFSRTLQEHNKYVRRLVKETKE